jgi:hypothetical protein
LVTAHFGNLFARARNANLLASGGNELPGANERKNMKHIANLWQSVKLRLNVWRAAMALLFVSFLLNPGSAHAQADPGTVVSAATTTFTAVTVLALAMATFFVGLRIAKRVTRG